MQTNSSLQQPAAQTSPDSPDRGEGVTLVTLVVFLMNVKWATHRSEKVNTGKAAKGQYFSRSNFYHAA